MENDGNDEEDIGPEETFGDFMAEIEDHYSKLVHESYKAPSDAMEEWQAFRVAVNWNEWFFMPLLVFYIVLFLVVILFRNNSNVQFVIFTIIFAIVLCAQWINQVCAENWESIASQNYFQERGTFVAVFLCAPLLLLAIFQLVFLLVLTSRTLVQMKKLEFAAAKKSKAETELDDNVETTVVPTVSDPKAVKRKKATRKTN